MDKAMTSDEYSVEQMTAVAAAFDAEKYMAEATKRMEQRLRRIRDEEIAEDSNFMKSMSLRMERSNQM